MKKTDRIQQKKSRKKQQEFNLREKITTWWKSKNSIFRFALGFAVCMGTFYGFWLTPIFTKNILTPIVKVNALLASKILLLLGYHTSVIDSSIVADAVSINVSVGCDAVEPMAIFFFAVLLFPATIRTKLIGICTGIPILFALNQFRLVSLLLVGEHGDSLFGAKKEFYFNLIHLQVWPVIFIVVTLMLLTYWILFSFGKKNPNIPLSS